MLTHGGKAVRVLDLARKTFTALTQPPALLSVSTEIRRLLTVQFVAGQDELLKTVKLPWRARGPCAIRAIICSETKKQMNAKVEVQHHVSYGEQQWQWRRPGY